MSLRSLRSLEDEARERSAQLSGENRFFFPNPVGWDGSITKMIWAEDLEAFFQSRRISVGSVVVGGSKGISISGAFPNLAHLRVLIL